MPISSCGTFNGSLSNIIIFASLPGFKEPFIFSSKYWYAALIVTPFKALSGDILSSWPNKTPFCAVHACF